MDKLPTNLSVPEAHKILDELSIGIFEEYIEASEILDIEPKPVVVAMVTITINRIDRIE